MPHDTNSMYGRRRVLGGLITAGTFAAAGCIGTDDPAGNGGNGNGDGNGNGGNGNGDGNGNGGNGDGNGNGGTEMAGSIDGWGWDIAARSLQLTAEAYEEEHDASVTVEEFGRSAMKDDLQTRLASGSGAPDVAMLEMVDGHSYIDTGSLTDLSGHIEDAGVYDDFVPGVWEALSTEDAIYALPWDIGPTAVYYRRDVYDEHGLDADSIETWDDVLEEGQKLPDDVYMLNLPPGDLAGVWRYQFRQLGNNPFTDDGAVNIHDEDSVTIARTMKELHDAGVASMLEGWSSAWFGAYESGEIASLPSAAWMEGTLRAELPDTAGDWGVYKIPAFESGGPRASNWGGSSLMIPAQIEEPERNRGWDYIQWSLATEEMQMLMFDEFGLFPALETTYENEAFDEELDFFGGQPARRVFADVAQEIPDYRFSVDTPEVSNAINTEFERMLRDDLDPEEAVMAAAETVAERTDRELA